MNFVQIVNHVCIQIRCEFWIVKLTVIKKRLRLHLESPILNEESKAYEQVKAYLDDLGIPYIEDPNLVRGLDYYTYSI